ncbi:MAG TPA: energy transducer TonB [Terriglobales bacterium]|nr:energy transducer TonB [Terriglobales bacterium]
MASFGIQAGIIGILVLIPLIYTEALPKASLTTFLVAPPPPPPPPPPPAATPVIKKVQTDIIDGALRTPTKIPDKIVKVVEDEAPAPSNAGVFGGVPGGIAGGSTGGVLGGVLSSANSTAPKVAVQKVRVSQGVLQGNAISQPKPQYPMIAKNARISGAVVLAATISKNGNIENLRLISGPPMLVNSAMEAVKQWRYKPYMLNGEPVEVETSITVNFTLGGG